VTVVPFCKVKFLEKSMTSFPLVIAKDEAFLTIAYNSAPV